MPADNEVSPSVWTCIEPAVGIVAACLSNMRPLFRVAHQKLWKREHLTSNDSTAYTDSPKSAASSA